MEKLAGVSLTLTSNSLAEKPCMVSNNIHSARRVDKPVQQIYFVAADTGTKSNDSGRMSVVCCKAIRFYLGQAIWKLCSIQQRKKSKRIWHCKITVLKERKKNCLEISCAVLVKTCLAVGNLFQMRFCFRSFFLMWRKTFRYWSIPSMANNKNTNFKKWITELWLRLSGIDSLELNCKDFKSYMIDRLNIDSILSTGLNTMLWFFFHADLQSFIKLWIFNVGACTCTSFKKVRHHV